MAHLFEYPSTIEDLMNATDDAVDVVTYWAQNI